MQCEKSIFQTQSAAMSMAQSDISIRLAFYLYISFSDDCKFIKRECSLYA